MINRRILLAGLIPLASCGAPLVLPTLHIRIARDASPHFFESIRTFARDEHFKLDESEGAFGTIPFARFILSNWRSSVLIETDIHAPLASLEEVNTVFSAKVSSTHEPMPWALHEVSLRALSRRLRTALTATPGVEVVAPDA